MRNYFLILGLACAITSVAQVNGYARITAISGATLTVGASNEAAAQFVVGKEVVLMQMQDDVIGSNTANNISFGNLSSIQQAGRYEIRTITSVARNMFGAPTGMVLNAAPSIAFNTGANSRVQAITFELMGGGGNFTTTSTMFPLAWNGDIGGVLAVQVGGTLTMAHSIHADNLGFRGGAADQATSNNCNLTTFTSAKTDAFAYKGEGIYLATSTTFKSAKGKIINGGGGGNEHNGGGGGGGNFSGGGTSGPGHGCGAGSAGGIGGIGLAAHIATDRVFMGGGGGGGEGNNNVATNGVNGGGIVLIKADRIRTTGSCSSLRISANGESAANSGNDGAGGGGAGGSIVLEVVDFEIANSCSLAIQSNGGRGGRVNDSNQHGGGGGGGQGVVIFSSSIPLVGVTVATSNGVGGCNTSASSCTSQAESGQGANDRGILNGVSGPLPVELLSFQATQAGSAVHVTWSTATERNSSHFIVQRSIDAIEWENVGMVEGAGNSTTARVYRLIDEQPLPRLSYYRLEQVDYDGAIEHSGIVPISFAGVGPTLRIFPNPADIEAQVFIEAIDGPAVLSLIDASGRKVAERQISSGNTQILEVGYLPSGAYMVVLVSGDQVAHKRLLVQH